MTTEIFAGLPDNEKNFVKNKISIHVPTDIIDCVCHELSITRKAILSPIRTRPVVEARQIAIALVLSANNRLSLVSVGKMFNRDHSTIIYARETFNDLYNRDVEFTRKVDLIKLKTHNIPDYGSTGN